MKHLVTMVEQNGCHGNQSENDATATYRFWQLTEIPVQKEVGVSVSSKDGGVIPDSGFPRDEVMANKEELARTNGHGANTSISYNTHTYTGGRLIVIPLNRAFSERNKFDAV